MQHNKCAKKLTLDPPSKNKSPWDPGTLPSKICESAPVYSYIPTLKVENVSPCIYFAIVLSIFNGRKDISSGNWNKFIKILSLIPVPKVKREHILPPHSLAKDCEK